MNREVLKKEFYNNVNYDEAETGYNWDQDTLWSWFDKALTSTQADTVQECKTWVQDEVGKLKTTDISGIPVVALKDVLSLTQKLEVKKEDGKLGVASESYLPKQCLERVREKIKKLRKESAESPYKSPLKLESYCNALNDVLHVLELESLEEKNDR